MPVNKAWSRREYLGEHEIAQNLTLSSKTHSCKIESYSHRGDRTMDQGRKDLSFYRTVARFVRSLMGLLIIAAWPGLALAQGGETEVTKTTPSNPPPVVSAPAPVPPAPARARSRRLKSSQPGGRKRKLRMESENCATASVPAAAANASPGPGPRSGEQPGDHWQGQRLFQ